MLCDGITMYTAGTHQRKSQTRSFSTDSSLFDAPFLQQIMRILLDNLCNITVSITMLSSRSEGEQNRRLSLVLLVLLAASPFLFSLGFQQRHA